MPSTARMPVHQISVVPIAKETASNIRSSSRTRDKSKENEVCTQTHKLKRRDYLKGRMVLNWKRFVAINRSWIARNV